MPRPRKPYLHLQITRHGKKVWYFRRHHNGPRISILGDYDSPEFSAAYDNAYAGQPVAVGPRSRTPSKGTLAWLIDQTAAATLGRRLRSPPGVNATRSFGT